MLATTVAFLSAELVDTPVVDADTTETRETARVESVLDGATIKVKRDKTVFIVRYIGVDAPQMKNPEECFAKDAAKANKKLVGPSGLFGMNKKTVELEPEGSESDSEGRLLRHVWFKGSLISERLLRDGAAVIALDATDTRHRSLLAVAEEDAHSQRRGLWNACSIDQAPVAASITRSFRTVDRSAKIGALAMTVQSAGSKLNRDQSGKWHLILQLRIKNTKISGDYDYDIGESLVLVPGGVAPDDTAVWHPELAAGKLKAGKEASGFVSFPLNRGDVVIAIHFRAIGSNSQGGIPIYLALDNNHVLSLSAPSPTPTPRATPGPTIVPTRIIVPTTTPTPHPTPRATPTPTPQALPRQAFVVNSLPIGCHTAPNASAPIRVTRPPGNVETVDQTIQVEDGTWHRSVSTGCWVRTAPGPVQIFPSLPEASSYALPLIPAPPPSVAASPPQAPRPAPAAPSRDELIPILRTYLSDNFRDAYWFHHIKSLAFQSDAVQGDAVQVFTDLQSRQEDRSSASRICAALSSFVFDNTNSRYGLKRVHVIGQGDRFLIRRDRFADQCD
jgi:endonuclease YncB( thermonuclease family)